MTSRERLLTLMQGELPDCVPVCPDISNMVPCRLTGKPFWDIYAKQDPPLWKAHIDALKYFDIDGGFELYDFGGVDPLTGDRSVFEERIVYRWDDGHFATMEFNLEEESWGRFAKVYTSDNPPGTHVDPTKLGLRPVPTEWESIANVREWPEGIELWKMIRKELGDQGVLGMRSGMGTAVLARPDDIYDYYDNPTPFHERIERMKAEVDRRMGLLSKTENRPDFLLCGGSGTLVFQSPDIFRSLVLPLLSHTTRAAAELGIPTHVHSCGPEKELVKMAVEETDLSIIDPLEIAPMGDCDLADLKSRFGDSIILKGNLHTTEVMLNGTPEVVRAVSKQAIDDGSSGGKFILSTGDQCGRDTPDENLFAMVDTARTYGRY